MSSSIRRVRGPASASTGRAPAPPVWVSQQSSNPSASVRSTCSICANSSPGSAVTPRNTAIRIVAPSCPPARPAEAEPHGRGPCRCGRAPPPRRASARQRRLGGQFHELDLVAVRVGDERDARGVAPAPNTSTAGGAPAPAGRTGRVAGAAAGPPGGPGGRARRPDHPRPRPGAGSRAGPAPPRGGPGPRGRARGGAQGRTRRRRAAASHRRAARGASRGPRTPAYHRTLASRSATRKATWWGRMPGARIRFPPGALRCSGGGGDEPAPQPPPHGRRRASACCRSGGSTPARAATRAERRRRSGQAGAHAGGARGGVEVTGAGRRAGAAGSDLRIGRRVSPHAPRWPRPPRRRWCPPGPTPY